jgi:MoaA/NifB/PqqE/SkfB family radical SAM enzyme
MYKLEEITQVHLEVTEACQAACPMCPRIYHGQVNPHLSIAELTLEDCKKIFEPQFLKQLKNIYLCGNYGDPIIAKELLEILQYFREQNPLLYLNIHTNGGARTSEWWAELASIIGKRGSVIFGIDGLKDTNHLYRKNVNWSILENSITSFISAGGIAEWQYIVFDHNQHQIQEAEELSKMLGFFKFFILKTNRFIYDLEKPRETVDVYSKDGKKVSIIAAPAAQYQNGAIIEKDSILKKYGNSENYYNAAEINCKAITGSKIFISAEGILMPCCWLAGAMYTANLADYKQNEIWGIIDKIGKDSLNAKNGLSAAFNSGILEMVEDSWNKKSFADGKLRVCSVSCGKEFNPLDKQRL